MVRDRLSEYLEARHTIADTMYGFRPHRSAQDSCNSIVTLSNRSNIPVTTRYVRQFLMERRTYLRIQDKEHGPYPLGVQHALYADDITLWATQGFLGSIETCLQHAASIVDNYARSCGLECSPTKSDLLHGRIRPHHGGWYTAAVVHQTVPIQGLTFRAPDITHAEEVAIALAAADPASRIIITDSRRACQNLTRGRISDRAAEILKRCYYLDRPNPRTVIWTPAHTGLAGNEAADASARALNYRDPPGPPSPDVPEPNPATSFREITAMYKSNRLRFPPPASGLPKKDERWLLRLYTNTVLGPAILKHFNPAFSGECPHCDHPFADTFHMVWACPSNPAVPPLPSPSPPTRESWEAALLGCSTLEDQRALVARARAAAEATGVPD
ncbi:uncharacterized protein LOC125757537 [Rhipicephalus sanguineus]|uniref:uncharacterized protein LOC125757537 n=1 Tax=Rhipicephalus sanguineus TaxID=34632 RepID=UPI0020C34B4A|nr:uncharacterized protein LOC125757537 [Rhipicephalus sanguineus]